MKNFCTLALTLLVVLNTFRLSSQGGRGSKEATGRPQKEISRLPRKMPPNSAERLPNPKGPLRFPRRTTIVTDFRVPTQYKIRVGPYVSYMEYTVGKPSIKDAEGFIVGYLDLGHALIEVVREKEENVYERIRLPYKGENKEPRVMSDIESHRLYPKDRVYYIDDIIDDSSGSTHH